MKIIHLLNLFSPRSENGKKVIDFTIKGIEKSILYHKKHYQNLEILPIAVFYEEDEPIIPNFFKKAQYLKEDAYTKLGIPSPIKKKYPFLKEMFNKALVEEPEYDYLVYTNSDIILRKNFYIKAIELFENKDHDIISITRRTIPDGEFNFTDFFLKKQIINGKINGKTQSHPGHDTFVFKKGVLEKVDFGNVYIGFPPVGNFILFSVEIEGFQFKIYEKEFLTYHLGDDRSWRNKDLYPYIKYNDIEAKKLFFDFYAFNNELKKRKE